MDTSEETEENEEVEEEDVEVNEEDEESEETEDEELTHEGSFDDGRISVLIKGDSSYLNGFSVCVSVSSEEEKATAQEILNKAEINEDNKYDIGELLTISLLDEEGNEINLEEEVTVTLSGSFLSDLDVEGVVQFINDSTESVKILDATISDDSVIFKTDSFSLIGILSKREEEEDDDREITIEGASGDGTLIVSLCGSASDLENCSISVTIYGNEEMAAAQELLDEQTQEEETSYKLTGYFDVTHLDEAGN